MAQRHATTKRSASKEPLTIILANYHSALDAWLKAADHADRLEGRYPEITSPRICGGMTKPMTIIIDGKATEKPATPYYLTSRNEIDREINICLRELEEDHLARLKEIEQRRNDLMAAFAAAEEAVRNATPPELSDAKAKEKSAEQTYLAARKAALRYKPRTRDEAVRLLKFAQKSDAYDKPDLNRLMSATIPLLGGR